MNAFTCVLLCFLLIKSDAVRAWLCFFAECRDVLLPMMLRELSGALATMADGPHDERRNSLELLNNILEVLSRDSVVRTHPHPVLPHASGFILPMTHSSKQ